MKKQLIYTILSIFLILGLGGCDKYKDLIPSEYDSVIYLKQSGKEELTLYKTGEDSKYEFSIVKGGAKPEKIANARIAVMDDATLQGYSDLEGINYVKLPEDCYSFSGEEFSLTEEQSWHVMEVIFKTEKIEELTQTLVGETRYVLPLVLKSETDSIYAEESELLLLPTVETPTVMFAVSGTYSCNGSQEATSLRIPLTLGIANQWDFTVQVAVDESSLGGGQTLLPDYSLVNNGIVKFTAGQDTSWLEVALPALASLDDVYHLPLKLHAIEGIDFNITETVLDVKYSTEINLTTAMLSSNAPEPTEGSLANLLDENSQTFFHTAWSVSIPETHYLQVALPQEVTEFSFTYENRYENGNASVTELEVSVSADGITFTPLKTFTKDADNLPVNGVSSGSDYHFDSPRLVCSAPVKYVRFSAIKSTANSGTGKFFVWSYFRMKGM